MIMVVIQQGVWHALQAVVYSVGTDKRGARAGCAGFRVRCIPVGPCPVHPWRRSGRVVSGGVLTSPTPSGVGAAYDLFGFNPDIPPPSLVRVVHSLQAGRFPLSGHSQTQV